MTDIPQHDQEVYRIMLVADGEPQHGGLEKISYGSEARPILDGLYGRQREGIIWEANTNTNACRQGTPVYVMTTGYGAIPIANSLILYNVPGELSILLPEYHLKYQQSLVQTLPLESPNINRAVIVYYAGKSKRSFRNGIFDLIVALSDTPSISGNFDFHGTMYGARQHPIDKWHNLCQIFDALSRVDANLMDKMREQWINNHMGIAPFFEWF